MIYFILTKERFSGMDLIFVDPTDGVVPVCRKMDRFCLFG